MSSPSFDQREQIRDAIDVVDLVERYVPLRRQGANFVGRCPWHDDSRPSLQVNPQRQTFKCWVCNIGGDVFSFVMKIENVDFKEAMQILADMAGIELVKRPKRPRLDAPFRKRPALPSPNAAGSDDPNALLDAAYLDAQDAEFAGNASLGAQTTNANVGAQPLYAPAEIPKATLYRALDWLAGKYRAEFLNSPEAEAARAYVRDRGISDAASERFQIGYAPLDFGAVVGWVGADRNRVRTLETAGVLAYREDYDATGRPKPRPRFAPTPQLGPDERRRYYDRFRGRLIFPIRDVQDRVVAFGGRLLPNTTLKSPAKYVNSPETPIFTKSKMVYGLDLARNAIRKTRKVVVVEGYTDCVMAAQFGFENVVAVLGT
ncbi:MAG: toprim domain-containing protein, partial [Thermoguttaceae bacterium]|nr:toprim domain-containing protein [Thermoguttaceae bacterium]